MKSFNRRFQYALRALVDLALHQGTGPVPVKGIAQRQGIPAQYLEQLFHQLKRHGLVIAERGPRGGYRLNRSPSEIPVSQIFQSLETRMAASPDRHPKGSSSDPSLGLWKQVEAAVTTTLQATTLEDLVAQARESSPTLVTHRFPFHI